MPSPGPAFGAIDFGASTGRVLSGRVADGRVELKELARFANRPLQLPNGLHWNLMSLFECAVDALAAAPGGQLRGVGVDTWGVDYGLLDGRGRLLGLPFHYRDGRTSPDVVERTFARASREEQYAATGIQTMPINTVFQLVAEDSSTALREAERIALVPDLLAYWLSGELANEATNASTTGLLDARTGAWAHGLIEQLGLPSKLFGELVEPGTVLGPALAHHGLGPVPVTAVASHDTASAFVAAPIRDEHSAILSSGTWSLLGLELPAPVLTDAARDANLTNERGVAGTTRLLKNVMGLWLEQECARTWGVGHAELFAEAEADALHRSLDEVALFDPDGEAYLAPGDMPARIETACVASGQVRDGRRMGRGEIVRSILVSLACKYRYVLERLEAASGRDVRRIHTIGGGARVTPLCRLTADLTGREVLAGPVEATALGNVLIQALAAGELSSLADVRAVAAASADCVTYAPSSDREAADRTYARFLEITRLTVPNPTPEPSWT